MSSLEPHRIVAEGDHALRMFTTQDKAGKETVLVIEGFKDVREIYSFIDKLLEMGVMQPRQERVN